MVDKSQEAIKFAIKLGIPQISLHPIRERQEPGLINDVIEETVNILDKHKENIVKDPLFFVGSVDFMVRNENGKKEYYVLETNGGSSRGFSALPEKNWIEAYDGYAESIKYVKENNPVVIIGAPLSDLVYYEKILLANHIKDKLKETNKRESLVVFAKDVNREVLEKGNIVIIGSYKEILPKLEVRGNVVYYENKKASVLIGDGIARRKPDIVEHLIENDLATIVVNDVFFVTDDKSLTYLAVRKAKELLDKYSIYTIDFDRAFNVEELKQCIGNMLEDVPELLIKPHGGSGGSGIDIITKKEEIDEKISSSIDHFYEKFGKNRNPYPYTVCKRVKATPIEWQGGKHQYDIRVYVVRINDKVIPVGALMRVALESFTGHYTKKSFVVNLSGYEGVDTDRGFGLSKESLKLFNLERDDFVNIFSAASTLMSFICNNYTELVNISLKSHSIR